MDKKIKFSFKKDKYKSARGGYSRLLNVCCRKCESIIVVYQKDGPGNLRRLYFDRIFSPENLAGLEALNIKNVPELKCKKCNRVLGTPYIYPKEKRKAFRLYQDAVIKRVRKLCAQYKRFESCLGYKQKALINKGFLSVLRGQDSNLQPRN